MRLLLDTCVISELQRRESDPRVRDAIERAPEEELFLSVITLGELTKGIALLPEGERKSTLGTWLALLERESAQRLLPVDGEIARLWGRLAAEARQAGQALAMADGLIAATAIRHGLAVMTRNVREFAPTGVTLVNPWVDGSGPRSE